MSNEFFTVIDLDKLADKLEDLGFTREPLTEHGKRSRKPAANEPDDWPQDSDSEADPWSDDPPAEPARQNRSTGRSAPRERSSSRSSSSSGQSRNRQGSSRSSGGSSPSCARASGWPDDGAETDRFDREWFFGEQDAPECHGGHVAARVVGVSQAGKDYEVWACPAGFGKSYKSKCDLWDYV